MEEDKLLTPKIFTLKGFAYENVLGGKKALDVGCGFRKLPGARGIDIIKTSDADIAHDLAVFPWPVENNSFDIILLNSVLEHMPNVLKTMKELYRISKPGARVVIKVPHFRCADAFADPTHSHYFTSQSMDYFIAGTELGHYGYASGKFKKLGFWYGWPHASGNPLKQMLKVFIHKFPDFYDQYLSLLLPTECIFWELEVVKDTK